MQQMSAKAKKDQNLSVNNLFMDHIPPSRMASSSYAKHCVSLTKDSDGFGIRIAERDCRAGFGLDRPICITAIEPSGSAIRDGRLKQGDMLIDVNGIDVTRLSQPEVAKILKSVRVGETVDFVISRRREAASPVNHDGPGTHIYEIPLRNTKSAGLGLYLKFPSLAGKELGVWIASVITGGAAWKDGRLRPDDQIISIDGINLEGLSNHDALGTLMAAICQGIGPEATADTIRLGIHRWAPTVVADILQDTNDSMVDREDKSASLQSSDDESIVTPEDEGFHRGGFGRRTISEKRDPELPIAKNIREQRQQRRQLEELQSIEYEPPNTIYFSRNARRNDSFRAAINNRN